MSRGQAQRVALARAFLKDAPVVVLDEPTAYLDPEVEEQVQEAMARLLKGRTALVIAHRLNSVQAADRVLLMDGGRLVSQGTHGSLLERSELYRRMVRAYAGGAGP